MRGDLTIRTVRTKSGATAVQVVQNKGKQRFFLKHIGSAHTEQELELLMAEARQYAETHCRQPNLFAETPAPPPPPLSFQDAFARSTLVGVTHQFARTGSSWPARGNAALATCPSCIWTWRSCASSNQLRS